VYAQDEWRITDKLTMNAGLRFDQMWEYTNANQLSPRISFTYKPFKYTTFHAGYARYFTPPVLVEAAPANIALFNGTSGAPASGGTSPVLPERSHYFDAGVNQTIPFRCYSSAAEGCPTLELGLDAYYKIATDLIDNGQFGQALVLSAFNYAKGVVPRRRPASLCEPRREPGESHPGGVEPIFVRQRHGTARSRRLDRTAIYQQPLDLHRSRPACDRLGWRGLSILRPGFDPRRTVVGFVVRNETLHRHDLWLGIAHRRRQYRD
jgi:hypothetical protein